MPGKVLTKIEVQGYVCLQGKERDEGAVGRESIRVCAFTQVCACLCVNAFMCVFHLRARKHLCARRACVSTMASLPCCTEAEQSG